MQETILCHNPATGELLGEVSATPLEHIPEALKQARHAQQVWASLDISHRQSCLHRIRDYLVENADAISEVISKSTGKPQSDALTSEVFSGICAADWYANQAEMMGTKKNIFPANILFANKRTYTIREPLGVIGIISPWNYPFSIPFGEIMMALVTGNAVIYKVAEDTALVGKLIEDILKVGDFPEGLCQSMIGNPKELTEQWFAHGIDKLFFTGSVHVGKQLLKQAADTLTPVSLELGGNDAMIILDDANLERAANGAIWGGFQNSGQACASIERVYVQRSVLKPFLALLQKKMAKLRQGIPQTVGNVDVGSITVERQLKIIDAHVKDALKKGATLVAQAELDPELPGHFYPATVLSNMNHDMLMMQEETFGPVIGIMAVDTEQEAIKLANDSEYGLTSSVWTSDRMRGEYVAKQLQTGITTLNDHTYTHVMSEVPWLGWKNSGLGATHGEAGLEEMTKLKVINYDITPQINSNLWWFPTHPLKYEAFLETAKILFGNTLEKRFRSVQRIFPKLIKDPLLQQKVLYLFKRAENKSRSSFVRNVQKEEDFPKVDLFDEHST